MKIIWITDDQVKHKECYKERWKEVGELLLTDKFQFIGDVDFVVVDYGHLNNQKNVDILREYFLKGVPIVWSGGLGGTGHYEKDCVKMFPNQKWLHKIESVQLSDLMWYVSTFEKRGK